MKFDVRCCKVELLTWLQRRNADLQLIRSWLQIRKINGLSYPSAIVGLLQRTCILMLCQIIPPFLCVTKLHLFSWLTFTQLSRSHSHGESDWNFPFINSIKLFLVIFHSCSQSSSNIMVQWTLSGSEALNNFYIFVLLGQHAAYAGGRPCSYGVAWLCLLYFLHYGVYCVQNVPAGNLWK